MTRKRDHGERGGEVAVGLLGLLGLFFDFIVTMKH
jgi:hypothetical protein